MPTPIPPPRTDRCPRARSTLLFALPVALVLLGAGIRPAAAADDGGWSPWTAPAGSAVKAGGPSASDLALVRRGLVRKTAALAGDGSPSLGAERLAGKAAPPSLNAVVLLCDFSDSLLYGRWTEGSGYPPPRQSEFYYAAHDSLYFQHLLADVATYFQSVSNGAFTLEFDVCGTVASLPQPMRWYGNHPEEGEQTVRLAADVVSALDAVVDFRDYDTVILVHAGAGEETDILDNSPEQIFSTYLGPEDFAEAVTDSILADPWLTTADGDSLVTHVLVLPETEYQDPIGSFGGFFGSLGVYCFEVGLRLGMLSLSDFTPAGRPDSQGIGEFGLMGYGLFVGAGFIPSEPCAFNKLLMGWLEPYPVLPAAGDTCRLYPVEDDLADSTCARVEITGQEYWLLEYRLQDPDGNRIFSWNDDLNHDGVPNFFDDDSALGNGIPTGFFDPATDTRETLAGGEFDFFMSENTARAPGVKGAGSGIYIWHVDEGVIQAAFGQASNLFNADPERKSVDLEEADGIQDLDSREPSEYILGGDDDSFRAEDNARFAPDTAPGTETAGGAWTGILIDAISAVVADSLPADPDSIVYEQSMTFHCGRMGAEGARPDLAAEVTLPGVDLRGSHLLAVDLDAPGDGRWEIVAAGAAGEVLAFDAALAEYRDGDADPATTGVLAVGRVAGEPVVWNGPAAAGDLDGDGRVEIVLTAPGGLYAFNGEDGSPLAGAAGDPDAGLLATGAIDLPPVLLPASAGKAYDPADPVLACVVDRAGGEASLRFLDAAGEPYPPRVLGEVEVPSPPLLVGGVLAVALVDTLHDVGTLALHRWPPTAGGLEELVEVPLEVRPGSISLAGGVPPPTVDGGATFFVVIADDGAAETVSWNGEAVVVRRVWPATNPVDSPLAPVLRSTDGAAATLPPLSPDLRSLAHAGGDRFVLSALGGEVEDGWPRRPRPVVQPAAPDRAPSPLRSGERTLFQSDDGRLYLYDGGGRLEPGWPLAGPGQVAGTPLLLDLEADGELELVAAGTSLRIAGLSEDQQELETDPVSRLALWRGVGVADGGGGVLASGWVMWRGTPWRSLVHAELLSAGPYSGEVILAGSHICYPSPLVAGPLHVRAIAGRGGSARAFIHDLEGEEVVASAGVPVRRGEPFEIVLPLRDAVSGVYVCRLVVETADGRREVSIVPLAVAR